MTFFRKKSFTDLSKMYANNNSFTSKLYNRVSQLALNSRIITQLLAARTRTEGLLLPFLISCSLGGFAFVTRPANQRSFKIVFEKV